MPLNHHKIPRTAGAEDKLSFEYSAIWVSNILPWIGRTGPGVRMGSENLGPVPGSLRRHQKWYGTEEDIWCLSDIIVIFCPRIPGCWWFNSRYFMIFRWTHQVNNNPMVSGEDFHESRGHVYRCASRMIPQFMAILTYIYIYMYKNIYKYILRGTVVDIW